MSTDIARRDTDSWVDVLPSVGDLAHKIAGTDFVPDAMRGKPAAVAAAILYGREIGLGPMQSLQSISVIKGKPSLSAESMRAMVLAAGHHMRFVEMTNTRCVVECQRANDTETTTVAFSMDDAKRMGLAGQQTYAKMPRQMLAARVTSEACRLVFPDVVAGFLSDVEAADPDPMAEPTAAPTPQNASRRTARRAGATTPTPRRTPPGDAPTAVVAPVDEPPLDDEVVDAEVVAETAPAGEPDMVSRPQLTAIATAMGACGWTDRDDRLRLASAVAGRPLSTSKELTRDEAGALLDALAMAQATDDPATFLAGLVEATGGES